MRQPKSAVPRTSSSDVPGKKRWQRSSMREQICPSFSALSYSRALHRLGDARPHQGGRLLYRLQSQTLSVIAATFIVSLLSLPETQPMGLGCGGGAAATPEAGEHEKVHTRPRRGTCAFLTSRGQWEPWVRIRINRREGVKQGQMGQ